MSTHVPTGRRPADRIMTRPTRTAALDARAGVARVQSRPLTRPAAKTETHGSGASMDYQQGFTSGPSS